MFVRPRRYASGTEGDGPKAHALPQRPEFPPPGLGFLPAFPPQLGDRLGGDLLFVWSFLHSFGDVLGVWPATVQQLLQALVDGERSRLLGELHIGMLRIVQADMEEAHATGAMQARSPLPPLPHLKQHIHRCRMQSASSRATVRRLCG